MNHRRVSHGFTLIELILVIVIGSVMAATLVVFFKPAVEGYLASRARADLTDQADTALRRMVRDVRLAVPNSVRTPGDQCFELVPSSTGGRYRSAPDTQNNVPANCTTAGPTCSAPLDTSQATTVFDVLTPLSVTPAVGDWVVVGNQTPADLYSGVTRAQITSAVVPPPNAAYGRHRVTVASKQFPLGYDGGRFTVVPNAQRAVFYVCSGAGVDASGNGTGTLYRLMRDFDPVYPTSCPSTAAADVLATRVRSCSFVYDPNPSATQQNGFVWIELELQRNGEAAHMAMGAHVANGP